MENGGVNARRCGALGAVILALVAGGDASAGPARVVTLGQGDVAHVAGTSIDCSVVFDPSRALLCTVPPPKSDSLVDGYGVFVDTTGSLVVARYGLLGREVVYSHVARGRSSRGAAPAKAHRRLEVRAGDVLSVGASKIGCRVDRATPRFVVRCAASADAAGRPAGATYGFDVRDDGTVSALRFAPRRSVLFTGRAGAAKERTVSLDAGDTFALTTTPRWPACGIGVFQAQKFVSCSLYSAGSVVEGSYGIAITAAGRVTVGRWSNGTFGEVFTRRLATARRRANDITIDVGQIVTVSGTRIACRVGRLTRKKFFFCALTRGGTRFGVANSYGVLLEEEGIAAVVKFDSHHDTTVVYLKKPG